MDIINRQINPKTVEENQANRIINSIPNIYKNLFHAWKSNMETLWNGNTEIILEKLGTKAVEVFKISQETVKFLESINPGCTTETLALRKPYTEHDDGRITLD